jgi:FixJ family two-component response regulator
MSKAPLVIAVVDDEESVRKALARLMSSAGLEAETFSCGGDFLQSLQTRFPDCLLLDIHMTGMDGFEVQAQLQRTGVPIPVITITGQDSAEAREQALAACSVACLSKPVEEKVLFEAIDLALSGKSPHLGVSNG